MLVTKLKLLALLIILTNLSACALPFSQSSINNEPYNPQDSYDALDVPDDAYSSDWVLAGEEAKWPDFIPMEIPELEGEIRLVMIAPDLRIRIFYENITDRQIEDYLSLLEQQGFSLEFIIYQQEGFPDRSEERQNKGEYDAVDITKGEYHMNLSGGDGSATYDIYTNGFEDFAAAAVQIDWPEELKSILPPPDRCDLDSVNGNEQTGYIITCTCEDPDVGQDYINQLLAQGYTDTGEEVVLDSEGNAITQKLRQDSLIVTLYPGCSPNFRIETTYEALLEWPEVFLNELPQPTGCTLTNVFPSGSGTIYLTCRPESDEVLDNYAAQLEAAGFSETNRLKNQNNEPFMIVLMKGQDSISLAVDSAESISITFWSGNP